MDDVVAVIMAGGAGTRFWPLSRKSRPKQLLSFGAGAESLLQATARRLEQRVASERIYVVTSQTTAAAVVAQLPHVPSQNILAEPVGRNTAACVGWAAATIEREHGDVVMGVLPADHHVGDERGFVDVMSVAAAAAEEERLVTVGIRPTRAETGYGYIELGAEAMPRVHHVERFVEKPPQALAEQFLREGRFLWNSGMFFFRTSQILDAIRRFLPELFQALERLSEAARRGVEGEEIARQYATLPSVSIDHGIMEKAPNVFVVPGEFGWSDLGSWESVWELSAKDDQANALTGKTVAIDSTGCYVEAPKEKLVAVIGARDLVIVDTEDALLIVPRERSQDVREMVAAIQKDHPDLA